MTTDKNDKAPTNDAPEFPAAPKNAKPMTLALWGEAESAIQRMSAAAESIAKVKGSMGEFTKRAIAEVGDTEQGAELITKVDELEAALEQAKAAFAQLVDEQLATLTSDLGPKRTAAEATYREAKDDWDSALRMIGKDKAAAKVLESVTVPTLPTKGGGTRAPKGSGTVKNAKVTYWRWTTSGSKAVQGGAQNSVSSLAYYYCGSLSGEKHGNIGALVNLAKQHGVDVKSTDKAWSLEIPGFGTIGMDVEAHPNAD